MLLYPRSSADIYCQKLELNLIRSGCFYVCENLDCKVISYYDIGNCRCGFQLKHKLRVSPHEGFFPDEEGSFLKSTARFMITDEFKVMPVADMADLAILTELGKYGKIEEGHQNRKISGSELAQTFVKMENTFIGYIPRTIY